MAKFGANYLKFNTIKEQPEGKLPLYDDKGPVQVGRLVKADLAVNMASGELYADDELAESLSVFSSGTLTAETDDILDEVAAVIYGCEVKDKEVHYTYNDTAPEGGLAYFKRLRRRGVEGFQCIYLPRVTATIGNDTAQTRNNSITFSTMSTTFTVFACNSGDWRITHECATEAEAKAWVDEKLGNAKAATPDPDAGDGAEQGETGTEPETAG